MQHELKIIMKFETEDFEHDSSTPILTHKCLVTLNDKPIGMIQDIKVKAAIGDNLPEVEISFPNLFDERIDPSYHTKSTLSKELGENIAVLKLVPNVKINLIDLKWE